MTKVQQIEQILKIAGNNDVVLWTEDDGMTIKSSDPIVWKALEDVGYIPEKHLKHYIAVPFIDS